MAIPKVLYSIEQPHGMGELYFVWQKGESRSLLATTGTDATVAIHDRAGNMIERIKLPGLCGSMEWDTDGDILAIICPNSNAVTLWECHTRKKVSIETGLREPPSCIAWAHGEPLLAVGTQKGNLGLYNHQTTKRIPIIGKHTKRVTCAAWNRDSILVLGSEDKSLSINNSDGETLRLISLRDIPNELQFSEMKTDDRLAGENTVSLIVGKRTLYLYNLLNPENPIELAFQQRYGSITTYKWYGDGYILLGFSAGFVISISTHIKEVGEELFQVKNHKDGLTDLAVCNGLAASCGDGQVKMISIVNSGEIVNSWSPIGGAERCAWSCDGRLLATAGRSYLNVYVTTLPALYAVYGTRVATLTSLTEATLYTCIGDDSDTINRAEATYKAPAEPTALAIGGYFIAFVRDSTAWFIPLGGGPPLKKNYSTNVDKILLASEHAAVLMQGRAVLHTISNPSKPNTEEELVTFPETHMQNERINDIHITSDFFIFVTDKGHIVFYDLEERRESFKFAHTSAILKIYCDIGGTRACILDDKLRTFVYNPASEDMAPVDKVPPGVVGVIWDICLSDRNVFIVYTQESINTYYYSSSSIDGSHVDFVASTSLLMGQVPLLLFAGDVYCYTAGGTITKVPLTSHNTPGLADPDVEKRKINQISHIDKLLTIRRFNEAWMYCEAVDDQIMWNRLGEAAIRDLNVEFAIRVYTRLSDVAMVWYLEDLANVEEVSVLCGMLCGALNLGDLASQWLEQKPNELCLQMQAAKGEWDKACQLAKQTDHPNLPFYLAARAEMLDLTGDYLEALSEYEKSIITSHSDDQKVLQHNKKCQAGVARTAIRCGDYMKGVAIALKQSDATLLKECAHLLEEEKQYLHAATLYENAGSLEKAAVLYIKIQSWLKVEGLLPKISSPYVHIRYAQAIENEERYNEAMKSYIIAQDFDNAIRLCLDKLQDVDEAVSLVLETKSVSGARKVANYFQNTGDSSSAIKFLVMSLCFDEAFTLARRTGKLDLYGDILIQTSQVRPQDFRSLALHFEGEKNSLLSGKYFFHAGEYAKALSHLLKVDGDSEMEALSVAIDAAASSDDDRLTRRLIEHLLGEVDGSPRDPRYLFRLYMAKRQYQEAAKTAVIICQAECQSGKYREARDVLKAMSVSLRSQRLTVTNEMKRALALLHSYILVRSHVRRGRHDLAARLLVRTANEISFFPTQQHQVSILTSTVIECSRANMKHAAHHWAKVLMQPEYRTQIDPKYSKKIESIVRHAPRTISSEDVLSLCPQCDRAIPSADLICGHCEANLPFCVATGLHIVKDDLTACPDCDFPAIYTEFVELLKDEGKCPMCGENVDYRRLYKIDNVALYLDNNIKD